MSSGIDTPKLRMLSQSHSAAGWFDAVVPYVSINNCETPSNSLVSDYVGNELVRG